MPKFKKLGDRCKWEEKTFCHNPYLISEIPSIIRVDGKNFSSFTKQLRKPFDERLVDLMIETTKFLVGETNSVWGFCQSDEITICLLSEGQDSQVFFDGKTQKIVSVTASLATAFFNSKVPEVLPEKVGKLATFDARAFNVPNLQAAVRQYVWRENDATRNSLSMLAQAHFPHSVLQGKKRPELHDLLKSKNINWNTLPSKYKRGTVVRRSKRRRSYSEEEIEVLPQNHEAKKNPNLIVERSSIEVVDLLPFSRIMNRTGVLFRGESPILKNEVESETHDQD